MKADTREKGNSCELVQKLFWQLFPVQVLICSVGAVNSLIDGVIGSRFLGAEAMAAVGLFNPVTILLDSVIAVLSVGGIMAVTRYMGKADRVNAGRVFSALCMILGLAGVGLGLLVCMFSVPLAQLLKGDSLLRNYMIGYCSFLFARMLASILTDALQVLGQTTRSMSSILAMAGANIAGDILLVCLLDLGIFGLGLATGLSFVAQLLVLLPPFLKKDCPLRFAPSRIPRSEFLEIVRRGLPSALGSLTISLKTLAQNYILMFLGGTMAVAAASVQGTFCWFISSITTGAGQTTLILMSLYLSEEDRLSMKNVLYVILRNSLIPGAVVMVAEMALARPLAMLYYASEPQALAYTEAALRILPLFLIPNIVFYVLLRTYQSQGMNVLTYIFSTIENLVIMAFILLLGLLFGVNGVWAGLPVGSFVLMAAILSVVWIRNKRFTLETEDLLLLPDSVGVPECDRMERTIREVGQAVGLSEEVCAFCRTHGLPEREVYVAGLSVEEISILLFRYSLPGIRKAQADVRIFWKNGKITIRIRDNGCPLFIGEKIEVTDPADPTANIGIRMLLRLTDNITANSVMGLNVITIVL